MTNIEKCKKYMQKQGLMGIKTFDFKLDEEKDKVTLKKYYESEQDFRIIEIPEFVTDIAKVINEYIVDMVDKSLFCGVRQSLKVINKSKMTDMSYLFMDYSGRELDLSDFSTKGVKNMKGMFFGSEIKELKLGDEFDTSEVKNMSCMFSGMDNIESIDTSKFNTSKVKNMSSMFSRCDKLKSIDVSNFNTSKVEDMSSMFAGCQTITELDLKNFDTSNVGAFTTMFGDCSNLTSIDVSSFDTRKAERMEYMFTRCKSIAEINLSNFRADSLDQSYGMFQYCENLRRLDLSNFDTNSLDEYSIINMYDCADKLVRVVSPDPRLEIDRIDTEKDWED